MNENFYDVSTYLNAKVGNFKAKKERYDKNKNFLDI